MIHEFMANFYFDNNQDKQGDSHISQAIHYYEIYGAHAKIAQLKSIKF